jgi:protein-disulfide isomerase
MRKFALGMMFFIPLAIYASQQNGEIALGNNTAPITMEVYSDFECPHCKTYHDTVLPQVIRDYVNTGKVYLIHRDFPLAMHKYSREAALYAMAAGKLFNKYEQVSGALFDNQAYWSANGKLDEVVAKALTPEEMKKVRVAIREPQLNQQLDNEIAAGFRAGVNSTPTTILTRHLRTYPVPSDVSYPLLKRFLDDLLSK